MSVPRLWFDSSDVAAARRRLADGESTTAAIYELAMQRAGEEPERAQIDRPGAGKVVEDEKHVLIQSYLVAHLLTGDEQYARRAYEYLRVYAWEDQPNLGRGSQSLMTALSLECCWDGWTPAEQIEITNRLVELHRSFYHIGDGGDPHAVINNHWGVGHAGSAIAAMAAHGRPRSAEGDKWDLTEGIAWSRGRAWPFLAHHGDAGLYHEGLGYMLYPACFWMPMVLAAKRLDGTDFVADLPHLANIAASTYITATAREVVGDAEQNDRTFGAMLSWNDAGLVWNRTNSAINAIALAPDHQKGALRWMYDRLNGIDGERDFACRWGGWVFTLLGYPYDTPPEPPENVLPLNVTDSRQGLVFLRNRYRDGDDAVLGMYAKHSHPGGHHQDDAGSIRLAAMGHDWALGGGQARGDAAYQSVFFPAEGRSPKGRDHGAILYRKLHEHGGVVGMDLRNVNMAYCERWLGADYSARGGCDVLVAMLDLADDHLGRPWTWTLSFGRDLQAELLENNAGFLLRAEDGTVLSAKLLGSRPRSLEVRRIPDSTRTFQSGVKHLYPGRSYLAAEFEPADHLNVYCVMAIRRGEAASIEHAGGLAVTIDGARWDRPMGAGIPSGYPLGEGGTLCRWPTGVVEE